MSNFINLETPYCNLEVLNKIINKKNNNQQIKKLEVIINSKQLHKYKKNSNTYSENSFVYFARVGNKFDGNSLVDEIINSKNFFISTKKNLTTYAIKNKLSDEYINKIMSSQYFLTVDNIEESLNKTLDIIFNFKNNYFHTIAVTGTNGKTSTVQICSQLYENLSNESCLRIGTLGLQIKDQVIESSHVTTPDYPSFLQILNYCYKNNIPQIIMETTSHGLEENRINNWLVDIAVFTNLTQDHLDFHGTMEAYRSAKLKLFATHLKSSGCAILCLNNDEWPYFCDASISPSRTLIAICIPQQTKTLFEKYNNQFKKVYCLEIQESKSNLSGNSAVVCFRDSANIINEFKFETPLIGEFQLYNILCAIAAMIYKGFSPEKICQNLLTLKNIPGRLEVIKNHNSKKFPTVLIDYAHSPDALEKAILVCKEILFKENKGKLITVFGCGGDRDKSKRALMGEIAAKLSDQVIVTSDNPRTEDPNKIIDDIFSGIRYNIDKCTREIDRKKAIELAIRSSSEFDLVLVAGKGHEDYQIIGEKKYPFSDSLIANSLLTEEKY